MKNILDFINRKIESGEMCKDGIAMVNHANTRKSIFDAATSAKGVEFLCEMKMKGDGLDSSDIMRDFNQFVNGNYVRDERYRSRMYCKFKGAALCDANLLMVQDCEMKISVPKTMICEIHVCGESYVEIVGEGKAAIVAWGDEEHVKIHTSGQNFKVLRKTADIK